MKPKTKDAVFISAIFVLTVTVVAVLICWEISLWHECRATNSFWYCMRVLGK